MSWLCQGAGDIVGAVGGEALSLMAMAFFTSWIETEQSFLTSWITADPLVDINDGSVQWLQTLLKQYAFGFALAGVLMTALYTVVTLRGDRVAKLGISMVRMLLVTTAGTGLFATLMTAMDELAAWVLTLAGVDPLGAAAGITVATASPGVAFIAAVVGIIGVIIQWAIMIIRGSILPLLLGFWPMASAAANLKWGSAAFEKITAWLIAFLLFKPIAAIVYTVAFRMRAGSDGIEGMVSGVVLIGICILALPALLRLITPATAPLGNMIGGAVAVNALAGVAAAGVAVGAAVVTGGASAGASAAGSAAASGGAAGGGAASGATSGGAASGNSATAGATGATGSGTSGASGATGGSGASGAQGSGATPQGATGGTSSPQGTPAGGSQGAADGATAGGSSGGGGMSGRVGEALGQQAAQNIPKGAARGVEDSIGG